MLRMRSHLLKVCNLNVHMWGTLYIGMQEHTVSHEVYKIIEECQKWTCSSREKEQRVKMKGLKQWILGNNLENMKS